MRALRAARPFGGGSVIPHPHARGADYDMLVDLMSSTRLTRAWNQPATVMDLNLIARRPDNIRRPHL